MSSFPFVVEEIGEKYRSRVLAITQIIYGSGILLNVLWLFAFKKWYFVLLFPFVLPLIIILIGIIFLIVDTPFSLITRF